MHQKMRVVAGAGMIAAGALPLLGGCGGGGGSDTPAPTVTYAYVADFSGRVSRDTVSPATGAFSGGTDSPVGTGDNTSGLAVSPDGRFAYATSSAGNSLAEFQVNPATGALTANGTLVGAGTAPAGQTGPAGLPGLFGITVSPSGKFAYAVAPYAETASVYAVNPATGALTPVPGGVVATGHLPVAFALRPDGRFAYVANAFDRTVSEYAVNAATGTLTPAAVLPVPTGVSADNPLGNFLVGLAVSPSGRFAYVTTQPPLTASRRTPHALGSPVLGHAAPPLGVIAEYAVDAATGAFTAVGSLPGADAQTGAIAVIPSGGFAYVANADSVSQYAVNGATGALTPLPQTVASSTAGTAGIAFVTAPR